MMVYHLYTRETVDLETGDTHSHEEVTSTSMTRTEFLEALNKWNAQSNFFRTYKYFQTYAQRLKSIHG